ncbi:hypothetical protein [Niabella ginsengisoli]|uniref:hypothetical protein n=1 Tax=Niabella ginsengisoli TaxID=522298 RepID=UPI00374D4A7D
MVDFIGGNAERPFVVGAFYTDDGKHENDHTNNHKKVIGTKTGRRLEIDDDKGELRLQDYKGDEKGNYILLQKNEEDYETKIVSGADDNNFSIVRVNGENGIF